MKDQTRNLSPTLEARIAMIVWGDEYSKQNGGSMDFYDSLSDTKKRRCQLVSDLFLDTIEKAKPEEQDDSVMAAQPIGGRPNFGRAREAAGFNQGVAVFENNLKKEINHE